MHAVLNVSNNIAKYGVVANIGLTDKGMDIQYVFESLQSLCIFYSVNVENSIMVRQNSHLTNVGMTIL